MRKKPALAALGGALLSATVVLAPSAQAAEAQNGDCESGEFCLYYNSDQQGSMVDMAGGHKNYGSDTSTCVKFITDGNGKGRCVKNNAASAWNREDNAVTVFYKNEWAGAIDSILSGNKANLSATKNENAGHVVGDSANSSLEIGLYEARGGRITAYFDGYLVTSGRHEGIDFAKGIGESVYALTGGKVTNVVEGYTGSSGLSTIAIYNADHNRTVVYLHTNPLDGLNTGDTVSRGQRIATESWRGVSSSSAAHTNVEMRVGEQKYAAKSVDDPDLDNPIPTEFWMNRGYNICCG